MPSTPKSLERAFRKVTAPEAPHQSQGKNVRYPGAAIASRDLGVHRGHLHRVLSGERTSHTLMARWKQWLKQHPEFARLQSR